MIIEELNLIGFGKFYNKKIKLKDGFNVIYGENEAGKTTIHNFINGMFYGFLKPYSRRTIYLEEHAKYEPWNGSRYGGVIKFTHDGKKYRIERDFTKNKEATTVFLEDTGEDITNSIDNGQGGRVLQPGFHFFGFNSVVFSNTLFIRQLGNKTDEALAKEVREKLVNISTSLDDISVEAAVKELDQAIKDIGSMRATSSRYARACAKLDKLKARREEILGLQAEYDSLLAEEEAYKGKLKLELKELKSLEDRLMDTTFLNKKRQYDEAAGLKKEIEKMESELGAYERYKDLSIKEYSYCIQLKEKNRVIYEKVKEYEEELSKLQKRIRDLEENPLEFDPALKDIEEDYSHYERLEEKRDDLRFRDYSNQLQFLKRDMEEVESLKSRLNLGLIASIIISLVSLALGIFISNYLYLINLFTLPLIILLFVRLGKLKANLIKLVDQIKEVEDKEGGRVKAIGQIESEMKDILLKYGLDSKIELKKLLDRYQLKDINKERLREELEENRKKIVDLKSKVQELKEEGQKNKYKLEELLRKNLAEDLDEFKEGLEKQRAYVDLKGKISTKEQLLNKLLGDLSLEELKLELEAFNRDINTIEEALSEDELKAKISNKKEGINELRIKLGKCEEALKHLNKDISQLVEIEEEIARLEAYIKELGDERRALELAKSTIEEISKDIHGQFAPMINRKVGRIIADITHGRYDKVKIDNSLEIGVLNPETEELVDIGNLSGGTIDQLYFALRFGIVDSFHNGRLPLILDDCFIQYDEGRLRNILNFLNEKSKERQIILFTCQKREHKILDEMNANYNFIHLT